MNETSDKFFGEALQRLLRTILILPFALIDLFNKRSASVFEYRILSIVIEKEVTFFLTDR